MSGQQIQDRYALSPIQEGMYFHHLYAAASGVDIEQMVIDFPEALDAALLERAWNTVIARHAVLRSSFESSDAGSPQQAVWDQVAVSIQQHDLSAVPADVQQQRTNEYLQQDRTSGFDLSKPPLLRLALFRLAPSQYRLVWTFHHILLDGRAFAIVLGEVFAYYEAFAAGKTIELPAPVPYRNYIDWLQSLDQDGAAEFWRRRLKGFTAPTPLLYDRAAEPGTSHSYGEEEITVPREATAALTALAEREGVTLNTVVMGAWGILLSRYSNEQDIIFGATKSARRGTVEGGGSIVGLLLNTIPVRVNADGALTVRDYLTALRTEWVSLRSFENTPLVKIRESSDVPPGSSLFDSLVVFESRRFESELQSLGAQWSNRRFELREQTNYTLTLLGYGGETLRLKLEFDSRRFSQQTVRRMLAHLELLLSGMAADPGKRIGDLPILTAAERQEILVDWNNTWTSYPSDTCLPQLIEAQAARTPDNIAVVSGGEALTYRELNARANQLARHLRACGLEENDLAGISMERSNNMLVALLAVLKSGAAYVPLDPAFPVDRLAFMAEDAALKVVLTEERLQARSAQYDRPLVVVDTGWSTIAHQSEANIEVFARPGNRAYILYTSGSTGKPKGVQISHRALVNFLISMQKEPGLAANDVLLAVTTISFDIAGLELYLPLITGARIVLASRDDATDGQKLASMIDEHGVTILQATPASWQMMIEAGWQGSPGLKVLCGGEALSRELAAELLKRCASLWNMYGPTETTIWSLIYQVTPADRTILIGRPIANTDVYILNPYLQPVPAGVTGELWIGGDSVAEGYLNREELTAEKFIPNPFRSAPGARIYRTGDMARYHAGGTIECLGRVDHQVKIRGFRIELGEIESLLAQYPGIQQNVVVAREDVPGDKRLVGYLVAAGGSVPDSSTLRAYLKQHLPDYMAPSDFVVMDALPLTPNGKINRLALPAPEYQPKESAATYVAPRNAVEQQLAAIWSEILRMERIGIHDNFFEAGGHSLLAVRLLSRILKGFPGAQLSLSAVLQNPTIAEFAALIAGGPETAKFECLVPLRASGTRPPFYCVHGAGGNVLSLRDLAMSLPSDLPFYALQARGLDGSEPFQTVEEAATHYVADLRSFQPQGPYYLGGGCFGGLVAYEMARQLTAAGQQVALLALIDSYNFNYGVLLPRPVSAYCQARFYSKRALHHVKQAAKVPPGEWSSYLGKRLAAFQRHRAGIIVDEFRAETFAVPDGSNAAEFHQTLTRVMDANMSASRRYFPQPYSGDVLLFRASVRMLEPYEDPALGWGKLVQGRLTIHEIPGDHLGITSDPGVRPLGAILDRCLMEAQQQQGEREGAALVAG